MNGLVLTRVFAFLVVVLSVNSSRSSNRHNRVRQPSRQRSNEDGAPRKLFDEFLMEVVAAGKIPAIYEEADDFGQQNTRQPPRRPAQNSSSTLQSSLRNYVRHRRPDVTANLNNLLRSEGSSSNRRNGARRETADSVPYRRAGVVATRRRHSGVQLTNRNIQSIEQRMRGVPREHWTCCSLGSLAGDKGFLCNSALYAARIVNRMGNRVQNRAMSNGEFFRGGAPTSSGAELLSFFSNCVKNPTSARQFQTCCTTTFNQRVSRSERWSMLRRSFSRS